MSPSARAPGPKSPAKPTTRLADDLRDLADEPLDDRTDEQLAAVYPDASSVPPDAALSDEPPPLEPISENGAAIHAAQASAGGWAETVWRTARQVAAATPEAVDWVLRPYVAAGSITELAAKVKCGKTTFGAFGIRAVTDGTEFLGWTAERGPVVLLTEERDGTLRQVLGRAGLLDCPGLHVLRRQDARGHDWPDVVEEAMAKCHAVGARLLVIDTLSVWAGLRGEDENASGAAAQAMEPVQGAASTGLGVLLHRHERKSGGEVGDAGRGSSAFTGAVDIALTLRRLEGDATAMNARRLDAAGRYDETPETLIIELTEHGYVACGTEASLAMQRAVADVLAALPRAEDGVAGLTMEELRAEVELPRTTVQRAIDEASVDGRVEASGEGRKGNPRRYRSLGFPVSALSPYRGGQKPKEGPAPPAGEQTTWG